MPSLPPYFFSSSTLGPALALGSTLSLIATAATQAVTCPQVLLGVKASGRCLEAWILVQQHAMPQPSFDSGHA